MKVLDLLGHHNHPHHHMRSMDHTPMNVVVDKIDAVKNGHAKGVVVYGYMSGCPHCIRYDGVWSEACADCPKGVFTYKVMMEDFPEDDSRVGTPPRSFPTVYSYTRSSDGSVVRKDHSQQRDDILKIMEDIATKGGVAITNTDGEEEVIVDEETPYRSVSIPMRVLPIDVPTRTTKKQRKRTTKTRRRGRKVKRGPSKVRSKSSTKRKSSSKKGKKSSKRKSK
jgi:hypothetical protein